MSYGRLVERALESYQKPPFLKRLAPRPNPALQAGFFASELDFKRKFSFLTGEIGIEEGGLKPPCMSPEQHFFPDGHRIR